MIQAVKISATCVSRRWLHRLVSTKPLERPLAIARTASSLSQVTRSSGQGASDFVQTICGTFEVSPSKGHHGLLEAGATSKSQALRSFFRV